MEWVIRKNQNESSELYHYGVKGMKWGVRKEYELKGRKAKKLTSSNAKLNSNGILDTVIDSVNKEDIGSIKDQSIRTAIGTVKIDGFDTDKKLIADWIMDTLSTTDRYASAEVAQKKLDELEQSKYTMAYTRGNSQTYLVNRDAPSSIRYINCFECSMAMEMRKRGYNVQAKEMAGGWDVEVLHAFNVKDAFSLQISLDRSYAGDKVAAAKEAYNQVAQQCLSFGDGARGCLGVQWVDSDSGHSMYWVVENGEFKIIDAQDSRRDGYEVFMSPADAVDHEISVYRLDNADLLPGVIDFVEPMSPVTEKEKEKASKSEDTIKRRDEIRKRDEQLASRNRQALIDKARDDATVAKKQAEYEKTIKGKVDKLVKSIGKATGDLISKGQDAIKKLFKVETVTYTYIDGKKVKL